MYGEPAAWRAMMASIARSLVKYLNGQIVLRCTGSALFDSWVGCLSPDDYRDFVSPHTRQVIAGVNLGVPVINFSTGTSSYLEIVISAGGDVIGIDWRVDLGRLGRGSALTKAFRGILIRRSCLPIRPRSRPGPCAFWRRRRVGPVTSSISATEYSPKLL